MAFDLTAMFANWQTIGVFDYILPFLLIFAVVFGILQASKLVGDNKGVHVIIALAIGLLVLQSGMVQSFFREIFPRLGVGLAVIISLVILTGLFVQSETKWMLYVFIGVGVLVWLIATLGSFEQFNFGAFENYSGVILGVVLLVGVIVAVVTSSSKSGGKSSS
jgi:hypothetical protein